MKRTFHATDDGSDGELGFEVVPDDKDGFTVFPITEDVMAFTDHEGNIGSCIKASHGYGIRLGPEFADVVYGYVESKSALSLAISKARNSK